MKTSFYLLAFFGLFFIASCTKQGQLTPQERRLIGTWSYTKVKFFERGKLSSDNLTNEYSNTKLTFKEDFTATFVDEESDEIYEGVWDIVTNHTGETATNSLFVSLSSSFSGEVKQVIIQDICLNNKRLTGVYSSNDGVYNYVLEK
jgi:hypothetical protein